MPQRPSMIIACLGSWMYAAVSCAALPFLHASADLKSMGAMAPLIAALVIGALVGVPLSIAVRCVSGFGAPDKDAWASLNKREAVFFGIVSWGIPLGLMFAVNDFLEHSSRLALVTGGIIWPVSGIAFGLLARQLAQRRGNAASESNRY